MDENTNDVEMRCSNGASSSVRALKLINPHTWPEERLHWLWGHLQTQDYAFDDPGLALGHKAFLVPLFDANSEWYEIGDSGIAVASSIVPSVNAVFHYAVWDDITMQELFPMARELFNGLFTRYGLNRITGYIPVTNKDAVRMATLAGFRYEGELRKAFLKNKVYHNLLIYGLLRTEFYARGEVRA